MAVKHKHKVKHKAKAKKELTPKQITAKSATKFGVPFWILWGIAGAESTWGEGGSNIFGLLDAAEGADVSNWKSASEQAARTLRGLHKQYGSWSAAIEHYSGYSYNISHPKELAAQQGVTPGNEAKVVERTLSGVGGATSPVVDLGLNPALEALLKAAGGASGLGGGGADEQLGKKAGEALNVNPLELEGKLAEGLIPEPVIGAFKDFDAVAKLLVSPQFWIRVAEGIGGIILLYMALKALTGVTVPGEGVAKGYAKAAAFKRLPPRQRVS